MERKLLLAIGLMIAVMILSNLIFPPVSRPPGTQLPGTGADSLGAVAGVDETPDTTGGAGGQQSAFAPTPPEAAVPQQVVEADSASGVDAAPAGQGDIIAVRSDLYEYRFDTRGARLVGASMLQYPTFVPGSNGEDPVELVRPGDALLSYRIPAGADTISLAETVFSVSATQVDVTSSEHELTFSAPVGTSGVTFEVTYQFFPNDYHFFVHGRFRGLGGRGLTVLATLGDGLPMNEAVEREDRSHMALVTRDRTGHIGSESLNAIAEGEVQTIPGGPFTWAASKSKYWLAALVAEENGPGFAGVVIRGEADEYSASMEVTLSVPAGSDGFEYLVFLGPQDFGRLQEIGQELHNVNPFGWRWLRWFIRPFGNLMMAVLIWLHQTLSMSYGWVLILFGVLARVVLFPVYQISMRQQMKQTAIQPEVKRIQERHKEDPQKLQQEMMKVYKEHGVNPLGGCLPMLLPFPILITLFFVFQNTIEFRGVPFLWLPDLSLKDPFYLVPLLMGASMLLLNWIGQRGMETNQQMKIFTYVLPVVFTFMFAQFASGLNLYYATSNLASLPQQMYLSRERRRGRGGGKPGSGPKVGSGGENSPAEQQRPEGKRRSGRRKRSGEGST